MRGFSCLPYPPLEGETSPIRLQAADIRRRGRNAELGFQSRDARFQRLVFLARQPRHVLDRLELLALDDVEIAQDFFGLIADHRIDLALDALGGARGVIDQAPDLVEKRSEEHTSELQSR